MPAAEALAAAGLAPIALGPKEGLALLNGTQFSTAFALAGLFEVELAFRSALVTGALSTDAARGSDAPFDPRIHRLRRHRGQIEAADALRALMQGSAIRESHRVDDERVQDPYCIRCQPQVMGAALDMLRSAAAMLATEANGVSDNPLIFPADGEALSGGNFHAEPVAFAADMIAIALCEIGSLVRAAHRHAGRPGALRPAGVPDAEAGAEFRLHDPAGHGRGAGFGEQAARLSGERRFHPDLRQPGGPRLDGGAWRAAAAADGGESLRGASRIELLAAAQGCEFHAPLLSSPPLEAVRARSARESAEARRGPPPASRYRGGDRACPQRRRRRARPAPSCCRGLPEAAMSEIRRDQARRAPLLVSIPHTGTEIPPDIEAGLVSPWLARKDTDWWIERLYDFAGELGATIVRATHSRTVIDVNRDPSGASLYPGQATTGLCPTETFDGEPLYKPGREPDDFEIDRRRQLYFEPYHAALTAEIARLQAKRIRASCSTTAIRSARSIPRLFDGELPHMNIGTNSGASCDPASRMSIAGGLRRLAVLLVVERPLQGRLDHPQPRPPGARRARDPDGARLPRLSGRADPGVDETNWPPPYDEAKAAADAGDAAGRFFKACLSFAGVRRLSCDGGLEP